MFRIGLIFLLVSLWSCQNNVLDDPWVLQDLDGNQVSLQNAGSTSVLMFITPDCPLSQLYAESFSALDSRFPNINLYGVNSGKLDSKDSLLAFKENYGFAPPILLDPEFALAKTVRAEVTPHFFILDEKGEIVYEGAMDDWAVDLGRKKVAPTRTYLIDALSKLTHDSLPVLSSTEPVGCIIEYER